MNFIHWIEEIINLLMIFFANCEKKSDFHTKIYLSIYIYNGNDMLSAY